MFNKKSEQTVLIFRAKKTEYREDEAIIKTRNFIEDSITRILMKYKNEIEIMNKHPIISFTEDEKNYCVNISILTPISASDDILSKIIDEIRVFFIKNKEIGYFEYRISTPYDDAIIENHLGEKRH